jgi:uncharacterized lipoprotein NlpE involved in copper resistance
MYKKLSTCALLVTSLLLIGCDVTAQLKTTSVNTTWDYDFNDPDSRGAQGFYIYKKVVNGTTVTWVRVGDIKAPATTYSVSYPWAGTYTVTAYSDYDESAPSNELVLIDKLKSPAKFRTN